MGRSTDTQRCQDAVGSGRGYSDATDVTLAYGHRTGNALIAERPKYFCPLPPPPASVEPSSASLVIATLGHLSSLLLQKMALEAAYHQAKALGRVVASRLGGLAEADSSDSAAPQDASDQQLKDVADTFSCV